MLPVLYEYDEVYFNTYGLGVLRDCISCRVKEVLNGEYELKLEYPINGLHAEKIITNRIITALVNLEAAPQPFIIYSKIINLSGIFEIRARHISYKLNGYPIPAGHIHSGSAKNLMEYFYSVIPIEKGPFSFYSDFTETKSLWIKQPVSFRSILGPSDPSLVKEYKGGELSYHGWSVSFLRKRGRKTSYVISYGRNLVDIQQEKNLENTYDYFYPYCVSKQNGPIEISGKVIYVGNSPSSPSMNKTLIKDLSSLFASDEIMTPALLRDKADAYLSQDNPGNPKVSLNVKFVDLKKTLQYGDNAPYSEDIALGDEVTVFFEAGQINVSARIISTEYDSLRERYENLEIGDYRKNIADTIYELERR